MDYLSILKSTNYLRIPSLSHHMTPDTVTIKREEYDRLKALEKVEWEVVGEFKQALKDLKEDKFIEC